MIAVRSEREVYQLAMAAGQDAGNRSMSKAGRKAWSLDDWVASAQEFARVFAVLVP